MGPLLQILGWLGVVVSIFLAAFIADQGEQGALIFGAAGILSSLILVGFGALIEATQDIRKLLKTAITEQKATSVTQ